MQAAKWIYVPFPVIHFVSWSPQPGEQNHLLWIIQIPTFLSLSIHLSLIYKKRKRSQVSVEEEKGTKTGVPLSKTKPKWTL